MFFNLEPEEPMKPKHCWGKSDCNPGEICLSFPLDPKPGICTADPCKLSMFFFVYSSDTMFNIKYIVQN